MTETHLCSWEGRRGRVTLTIDEDGMIAGVRAVNGGTHPVRLVIRAGDVDVLAESIPRGVAVCERTFRTPFKPDVLSTSVTAQR